MATGRSCVALSIALLLPALAAGRASAADCADYSQFMHWVGELAGGPFCVATSDGLAFAGEGTDLRVVEITDPASLRQRSRYSCAPDAVRDVETLGPFAFVGAGDILRILNVTDPDAPVEAARLGLPEPIRKVHRQGLRLYVCCGWAGVFVFDIADATHPRLLGQVNPPGVALDIALDGTVAYIASYGFGISIVDLANPAVPAYIDFIRGDRYSICALNLGRLFAVESATIEVRRIAPNYPVLRSVFARSSITAIAFPSETTMYAATPRGVDVFDTGSAGGPFAVAHNTLPELQDLALADGYFIGASKSGVISVRDRPPRIVASLGHANAGLVTAIACLGSLTVVAGPDGLATYDVTDAAAPALLGRVPLTGNAYFRHLALGGDFAYVAGLSALTVMSLRDPALPEPLGTLQLEAGTRLSDVVIADSTAFLTSYDEVITVDVRNAQQPQELGRVRHSGNLRGIRVRLPHAFVTGMNSLFVFDVSDPRHPHLAGGAPAPGLAAGLDVVGDVAYVTTGYTYDATSNDRGLAVFDISSPESPTLVSFVATPMDNSHVAVRDGVAYVVSEEELLLFDVRNPRAIRRLGQSELQGHPSITDLALSANAVAVTTSSETSELEMLPLQCSLRTATAVEDFAATRQPDGVALQARITGPLPRVRLLRAQATDPARGDVICERVGVEPGVLAFTDTAARPEAAYAYTLEWWSYGSVYGRTPALLVPGARRPLRIRVVSGNPSQGPVRLALDLPTAATAAVDVFDVSGRVVRQVFRGSAAGSLELAWDGRDARGNPVRSGVYVVRVDTGGRRATTTLVRLAPSQ